jgi:hypothetical protein
MKKIILFFCLISPAFAGMITAQNFDPKTVVPAKLAKYEFGMTLNKFKKRNKKAVIDTPGSFDFRIIAEDRSAGGEFESVVYYFDAENDEPLYEMIIQYKTLEAMEAYVNTTLKEPNNGKEWKWTTKEGYVFKAWKFGKKLVLALGLPSTEWYEN